MANKMDLVEKVASTIGCTKADGERAVEAIIETITSMLKRGEEVSIAGSVYLRPRRGLAARDEIPAPAQPFR